MKRQHLQLVSCLLALGGGLHASRPLYEEPLPFEFHAYAGFRQDKLSFDMREKREKDLLHHLHHHRDRDHRDSCNHGCHLDQHHKDHHRHHQRGNETSVNWKSLNMAQVGAIFDYTTCGNYVFKISADYGRILSGHANINSRFHFKTLAPPEPEPAPIICHADRRRDDFFDFDIHRHIELDPEQDREFYSVLVYPEDVSFKPSHKKRHRRRRHRHRHGRNHHEQPIAAPCPKERFIHHIEVSRQRANASDGDAADLSGAFGWKAVSNSRRTSIAGLLGWSGSAQHVHLNQVVIDKDTQDVVSLGALPLVSATYQTRWQGPWVGFDFVTLVDYCLTLYGSGEWHWSSFRSNGHWKYKDSFSTQMRQKTRAYGAKGTLGLDWNFCSSWTFGVIGDYQQWWTKRSQQHNRVRNKNSSSATTTMLVPNVEKFTLRRVQWRSFSISAQLAYRF